MAKWLGEMKTVRMMPLLLTRRKGTDKRLPRDKLRREYFGACPMVLNRLEFSALKAHSGNATVIVPLFSQNDH